MPAGMLDKRDDDKLRQAATDELSARQTAIDKQHHYYEGKHKQHLKIENGIDPNVVINLWKEVPDSTASFLLPQMPGLTIADDPETSKWLMEAWEENGGAELLLDIVTNGGLAGHSFVRVLPKSEDSDFPLIRNLDARHAIAWWRPDDYKERLWYELQWGDGITHKATHRQDVYPEGSGWLIQDYVGEPGGWKMDGEAEVWAYPLSPIVDVQHLPKIGNKYYGRPETEDYSVQDQINKITTDTGQIIRYHAWPQLVATGVSDQEQGAEADAVDTILKLANENAKVYAVEMASDLVASRAERDQLKSDFLRQARVIALPQNMDSFKGVTNLGIRVLYMPQSNKARTLQRKYGNLVKGISKRLLMLDGKNHDVKIDIEWGSALPVDEREELQMIQLELNMGIMSKQQAMEQRGRDPEEVRKQRMQEAMDSAVLLDGMMGGSMDNPAPNPSPLHGEGN